MNKLLIGLMFSAALLQFGISVSKALNCHSQACMIQLEKASRDVLMIDWKPISVFPEKGWRFGSLEKKLLVKTPKNKIFDWNETHRSRYGIG